MNDYVNGMDPSTIAVGFNSLHVLYCTLYYIILHLLCLTRLVAMWYWMDLHYHVDTEIYFELPLSNRFWTLSNNFG